MPSVDNNLSLSGLRFCQYLCGSDGFQGLTLRFDANVAVSTEHLAGDVASDIHNGLVSSTTSS